MSQPLEFTTAPKDDAGASADAPPLFRFRLDGVDMTARKPKDAMIAQLAPVQSRRTPSGMKVKLALDFLRDCVDEPGRTIIEDRLADPEDALDAEGVMPILTAMGDHWKQYADEQKAARKR